VVDRTQARHWSAANDHTDGPLGGDGWGSYLGRAMKRVERDAGSDSPLWRVLWLATDPQEELGDREIGTRLGMSTSTAWRWREAATRAVWAQVEVIASGDGKAGRNRAWRERKEAEEAEADAWQQQTAAEAAAQAAAQAAQQAAERKYQRAAQRLAAAILMS
jgi:hypothetical protein